ncbi:LexA repressor [Paenibacillus sp. 3LSP]|uniref:LexA family protein n=1 Tax=Paenibacillus sp. 3LSP TaxID=2800795 RepID=UPI0028FD3923|nr:helix-turn-helix domain-containing protein [Paenibacillus sp. 3LSP]MDU0329244.1 LexA repressor [Paenibacillus sp. 3LSP]
MTTNKPLTLRQSEALQFIESFVASNGYPPTVREIGENLGLLSSSTAFNLLEQLVKKGYVSKGPGPRMLRVIKPNEGEVKIDGRSEQRVI